jgi:hypothetical protein
MSGALAPEGKFQAIRFGYPGRFLALFVGSDSYPLASTGVISLCVDDWAVNGFMHSTSAVSVCLCSFFIVVSSILLLGCVNRAHEYRIAKRKKRRIYKPIIEEYGLNRLRKKHDPEGGGGSTPA